MKYPLVIAHRGASREAPGNTLPAFEKAIALGADGIECDLMLTEDKVPVVSHDNLLSKWSTTYRFVHTTPYRAIRTIDVGSHFSPAFAGVTIPTLSDLLALFRPTSMLLNLEIKVQVQFANGIEKIVADTIREFNMDEQVVISSFNPMILWRMKQVAPHLRRSLLSEWKAFSFLEVHFFARMLGVWGIHPPLRAIDAKFMSLARRREWQVMVWTLNHPSEFEHAMRFDVDGIITDDPLGLRQFLKGSPWQTISPPI